MRQVPVCLLKGVNVDYVAIDFETANERRASPCALGVAVVRGGELVERAYWLIRPRDLYFNPFNTYIHGITARDVRGEPELPDLWPAIRPYLEGNMVIAHNASFDMSVLRATLLDYGLPLPEFDYSCTCLIAKRTWPGLSSYRLDAMAERLGITFEHHQAEEDAMACAEVARRAIEAIGVGSLVELADHLDMQIGRVSPGVCRAASLRRKRQATETHPRGRR
jgi:DNA polymerase III subunit epsilon